MYHSTEHLENQIDRLSSELADAHVINHEFDDKLVAARAELATLRLYADEVTRDSNRELAAKDAAHDETRGLVRDLTTCLENRNRELAEAAKVVRKCHDERDAAVTAERAKDARIAELERHLENSGMYGNAGRYWEGRWRDAIARAERAEADADSLRSTIDNMRAMNIKLTFEATGKVLAAEAELNAMRERLDRLAIAIFEGDEAFPDGEWDRILNEAEVIARAARNHSQGEATDRTE